VPPVQHVRVCYSKLGKLVSRLSNQHMAGGDNELKTQLLACYAITGYNEPVRKRDQSAQKIQQEIEELKGEASGPPPAARREVTRRRNLSATG
jgi:hypothetical protein